MGGREKTSAQLRPRSEGEHVGAQQTGTEPIPVSGDMLMDLLETSAIIARLLTSPPRLPQLLQEIVDCIQKRHHYAEVSLYLRESGTDKFRHCVSSSANTDQPQAVDAAEVGSNEFDAQTQPIVITLDDAITGPGLVHRPDAHAYAGALVLRGRRVHPLELRALEAIAVQVVAGAYHAQFADVVRRENQLSERLNEIGSALSQTLDIKHVLNLILEQLLTLVPYDRGSVLLEEGQEVVMRAAHGFPAYADPLNIRIPLSDDDVYRTISSTQQPLLIPDLAKRPDWQYVEDLPPAKSWLGVPLILKGNVIGMLSLARERADPYTQDDATLAVTFAHQAAIALHNARLYSDLVRTNAALERTVGELHKRSQDLQIAYEQLQRLDRAKSDFITIASHELRTPLTVLSGYSQILLSDPVIEGHEYREPIVRGIQTGAERLQHIVDDMLDMARIDNQALKMQPEPMFVAVLFNAIRPTLADILASREVELQLDSSLRSLPLIEADTEGIRKVFYHLLVNAIKYTPDGGTVRVWGEPLLADQRSLSRTVAPCPAVHIVVSDTGIGIDPAFQELIFAKFYQTGQVSAHSSGAAKFRGGGPGLGLAIARGIVEAHGGRVWVESPGCDEATCPGSNFHVVLPLRPDLVLKS